MYTECNTICNPLNTIKRINKIMELFNKTGFEVGAKVQVTIDQKTYYGIVIAIDKIKNKIQVDYTAKNDKKPVIDWFQCAFWKKQATQKKV